MDQSPEVNPPYGWALLAPVLVALLYIVTLAPTTAFWDTSEYIATAHILGIPHPPGNPLFVVLARAWEILLAPLGLSVAVKINLFSTTMSALAHGFWFLVVHHILRHFSEDETFPLVGAFVAVLVSATAFTVWNQSNVNEKVYTVSLFTIALLSWLAFHWRENLGRGKDDNLLILMVFILALSVGNHLMAFLAAPALGLFILLVHPETLLNWKLYLAAVVATFLGLSIHLYLPFRAGLGPVINEASPTCETLTGSLTSHPDLGPGRVRKPLRCLGSEAVRQATPLPQVGTLSHLQFTNYLQYFDWQWARVASGNPGPVRRCPASLHPPLHGAGSLRRPGALPEGPGELVVCRHPLRDPLRGPDLLPELQVRVLHPGPPGRPFGPRGQGAGLLLHRELFRLGTVGRNGHRVPLENTRQRAWPRAMRRAGPHPSDRIDSPGPELALGKPGQGLLCPGLGIQPPHERGALRGALHQRGQRHLPPLVSPGSGGNPAGRHRHRHLLPEHRLVRPPDFGTSRHPVRRARIPTTDPTRIICQRPYTSEGSPGAEYVGPQGADEVRNAGKVPLLMDGPVRAPTRSILTLDDVTIRAGVPDSGAPHGGPGRGAGQWNLRPVHGRHLRRAMAPVRPVHHQRRPWETAPSISPRAGTPPANLGLTPYLIRQGLAYKLHDSIPDAGPGAMWQNYPSRPSPALQACSWIPANGGPGIGRVHASDRAT